MSDTTSKPSEKRIHERIQVELPVKLEIDGKLVEATTENVSCGGMFLPNLSSLVEPDQALVAFVTLPDRAEAIRVPAKILRVKVGEEEGLSNDVAVQFDSTEEISSEYIQHLSRWRRLN